MKKTEASTPAAQKSSGSLRTRYERIIEKVGIKSTIMLYLVLFVAFVILLLWLIEVVFLGDFYRIYKTRRLEQAGEAIIRNIDNADLETLAEHLATQNDACILLLNSNMETVISVDSLRTCLVHHMPSDALEAQVAMTKGNGQPSIEIFSMIVRRDARYFPDRFEGPVPHQSNDSDSMLYLYANTVTFADGTEGTLLINTYVKPVNTTVEAIRFVLVIITVVVLAAAVLLATLISRSVSKPIIETNNAARDLSHSSYRRPKHSRSYREITELNNTLEQAAHDLNRVDELQHELVANISHDLRTPLTMIGGYAEMMRDIPDETTPQNLQVIIDETARLTSLVNELLDFSRLQADNSDMHCEPFALTNSVEAMILRIRKLTQKDGYSVSFEPTERLYALADEKRIGQVIYNLIGNALTYTGADRQVFVTQERKGDLVRISIRDTGKGIPPDELQLIWNRYYRTKETHKRAVVGSGLGLNIVHTILEKHAAPYGVDSDVGSGTTFWFELPIVQVSDEVPALTEPNTES